MKEKRTHRVGTITCGVSLILFGVLYLISLFGTFLSYKTVMRFWPLVLIGLGSEILLSNRKESELKYDKGAVAIIICMGIFAAAMAVLSVLPEI